jgi:diaminohydroxyphosphoribosylaminopyrimidine deaminase / 5-amino-6-(5-phosphoribosylamino)uracil reductase
LWLLANGAQLPANLYFCPHLTDHLPYLQRCIELALHGTGHTAPNPLVGAVLVYDKRVIGEGYHRQYGQAHAEVNCLAAVAQADMGLIPLSTLYVSLEPCAHFGKTPPCADMIIAKKIPRVVIGCRDPFPAVDGRGIGKLQAAGIEVIYPVMENEARQLNRRFFTFHEKKRPFIVLKWAQTADGLMGNRQPARWLISNNTSNRLVHKWRSEEAAILVGTNTALADNPALTNRLWTGKNPVRLVLDMNLRLPANLQLFNGEQPTIVFNGSRHAMEGKLQYYQLHKTADLLPQLMDALYQLNILSVLVEGGAQLLQSFINAQLFDEVRIITSTGLQQGDGIPAPVTGSILLQNRLQLKTDTISFYEPLPVN